MPERSFDPLFYPRSIMGYPSAMPESAASLASTAESMVELKRPLHRRAVSLSPSRGVQPTVSIPKVLSCNGLADFAFESVTVSKSSPRAGSRSPGRFSILTASLESLWSVSPSFFGDATCRRTLGLKNTSSLVRSARTNKKIIRRYVFETTGFENACGDGYIFKRYPARRRSREPHVSKRPTVVVTDGPLAQ